MRMKVDFGPKFDWFDVLDRLIAGEKPSDTDRAEIHARGGPWTSCACGQMCKILPRDSSKCPKDEILKGLGADFARMMSAGDYKSARAILDKIEKRSTELLREMGILFTIGGVPRTFHRVRKPEPILPVTRPAVKPGATTHSMAERFVFRGGH